MFVVLLQFTVKKIRFLNLIFNILNRHKKKSIIAFLLIIAYYFCLPNQLFTEATSTVVTASNDKLLGAIIASDGQWRFPKIDSVPNKFKHCIIQFEDAHFYRHFGFNPVSMAKAFVQNIKAGKIVRGGSTLTQQVIRLSGKNKKRTYFEKFIETILATRLEFKYSKESILKLYASNAPYGGNVVGLEMAAWRYFKLKPYQLSWAESATLAVLPNAPALIYPGKNQYLLKEKRDKLLKKLYKKSIIDSITYLLSVEETLPKKPNPLPEIASHFVQKVSKENKGKRIKTTINYYLQQQINELVKQHHLRQKQNEVYNLSVLVLDVDTRKVLAYIGNSPTDKAHQKDVDNVTSGRSTGSVLKPLLYAQMLNEGYVLPEQLVADVPTEIAGYTPKNYNLEFDGAVKISDALTRSLNVPMVRVLQGYGLEKFREDLKQYEIKHTDKSANHYGLSLILGGSEASLWDLCKIYAGYAAIVNNYEKLNGKYYKNEFISPTYKHNKKVSFGKITKEPSTLNAGAVYTTLNTLTEVNRTAINQAWKFYDSSKKIAWKTGTSFGNKDAWAIGATSKYVVGIWVGNSDGEGRPELTGVSSASPLLFDVFNLLPQSNWFLKPYEDLIEEKICKKSGCLALPICPSEIKRIPKKGIRGKVCNYHKEVFLDKKKQFLVNSNCENVQSMIKKTWFVLPPLMEYFYIKKNATYKKLPNYKLNCNPENQVKMSFIYPTKINTEIILAKDIGGQINPVVLKLTHSDTQAKVYWYVNKDFVKETSNMMHQVSLNLKPGFYTIMAVDNSGSELKRFIKIL